MFVLLRLLQDDHILIAGALLWQSIQSPFGNVLNIAQYLLQIEERGALDLVLGKKRLP
jgi:hypothetical protein